MVRIDSRCYLLWAAWLLLIPADWLLAAGLAAAVHECLHVVMLTIMGVPIHKLKIRPGGAEILTGNMTRVQELICALAGPVGSFSLVCFCHFLPKTAICGCLQGLFNLLPIYPLDGGRVLRCGIGMINGKKPCKPGRLPVQ